ncbi:hypothetical protein HNQ59_002329 [Chitinivorax tropicus]|uniref:Preprotein translocase subunit YajC n=1 Tax=Chitinivorax tropicus TaxID=714531 RepID=A0A840MV26_9PROT|nr:PP0621 family protein [Chitinivorax tropicus]MBB5019031.1 hypothetical protein [Chitinivorax tropicus]
MLIRILAVLLFAYLCWRWFRQREQRSEAARQPAQAGQLLPCRRCGTLVPEQEALQRDGQFYCSETHAQQEKEL